MRTQDIQTCINTMALDRCRNDLTDLRVILNIMRQQTSFDYKMAVKNAELFFRQGKFDELGLLLMLISREMPGYDDNLVKNAQLLINNIADNLQVNGLHSEAHTKECAKSSNPKNDNQGAH